MQSGRNLWNELCHEYQEGVLQAKKMQEQWQEIKAGVDADRFHQVEQLLAIQVADAEWWRDACLSYFQTFSKQPLPNGYPKPKHDLQYYQSLHFPYAPGNGQ